MTRFITTAKVLSLLVITGLTGLATVKFIPQSQAKSLTGHTATFETGYNPGDRYAYNTQLQSRGPKINVRSGPGTSYDVNYVVPSDAQVILRNDSIGPDGYRWYYVSFKNFASTGWIREDLILTPNDLQEAHFEEEQHQQVLPEQYVVLSSRYNNSKINVRRGPGTHFGIRHYGLNGDPVEILDSSKGNDGYYWYELTFVNSRAKGWVREDLIAFIED